jgi:heme exporter protein D
MNFDAWQTVWICVALSVLLLMVDAWLANRAGPDKTELARTGQRNKREARLARLAKDKQQ